MRGKRFVEGVIFASSEVVATLGFFIGVAWILLLLMFGITSFGYMALPLIIIVGSALIALIFGRLGKSSKEKMDKDT